MTFVATGSPLGPFADAILSALADDANLTAIVGDGIFATTKIGERTPFPYIVANRRELLPGSVAMQKDGGVNHVWLDFWSDKNDPNEVQQMMSRVRAILPRERSFTLVGYTMYGGSLECLDELVIPDFDPNMPKQSLYHGVQHWVADLETA